MPPPLPSDYHRASSTISSAFRSGRSVLSLRRNQVQVSDHHNENTNDLIQFHLFHSHVANHLSSLSTLSPLSLPFIHKLLQSFLSSEIQFRNLLNSITHIPPTTTDNNTNHKPLSDLLDRFVKSLDILNDLTAAIHSAHHWNRSADTAASALSSAAQDAHLTRAKKALNKLLSDENPKPTRQTHQPESCRIPERAWSFLSRNNSTTCSTRKEEEEEKSACWPLAAKQLSAVSVNMGRVSSYEGVGLAAYTMSWLVVLVVRVLVAGFSGVGYVAGPVGPTRQVVWGAAMAGVEERVWEEWRRRKGKRGMLREIVEVERWGKVVMEGFEKGEEEEEVVMGRAEQLGEAARRLEEGLGELEREVRVVFHRIVRCREEVIVWLEERSRSSADSTFFLL